MEYSTPTPTPGHFMTKINAVCCTSLLEETQCNSEPLTWLDILIKKLKCYVLEIFSDCGECNRIIQPSM